MQAAVGLNNLSVHHLSGSLPTVVCPPLFQVLGTIFFLLASILYQPPPESPQSSCESTDHGIGDLPVKDLPEDGVIINLHARL